VACSAAQQMVPWPGKALGGSEAWPTGELLELVKVIERRCGQSLRGG